LRIYGLENGTNEMLDYVDCMVFSAVISPRTDAPHPLDLSGIRPPDVHLTAQEHSLSAKGLWCPLQCNSQKQKLFDFFQNYFSNL
jgi:hypothetical protein